MKLLFATFGLGLVVVFGQAGPPQITYGAVAPGTPQMIQHCGDIVDLGSIYVRTQDPANAPIGAFRCTQVGPTRLGAAAYAWMPLGHLNVKVLPPTCAVGDLAFKDGASPGQNMYACTTANVWTQQGGVSTAGIPNGTYCVQVATGVATLVTSGCPGSGGGGGTLSWATLTSAQWATLTSAQWAALTP